MRPKRGAAYQCGRLRLKDGAEGRPGVIAIVGREACQAKGGRSGDLRCAALRKFGPSREIQNPRKSFYKVLIDVRAKARYTVSTLSASNSGLPQVFDPRNHRVSELFLSSAARFHAHAPPARRIPVEVSGSCDLGCGPRTCDPPSAGYFLPALPTPRERPRRLPARRSANGRLLHPALRRAPPPARARVRDTAHHSARAADRRSGGTRRHRAPSGSRRGDR